MRGLLTVILLAVLGSCGNKDKDASKILPKEKMQAVMWEMLKANSYAHHYIKNDSLRNPLTESVAMQQQIFDLHKISKEQFFNSYNYYSSKPDRMQPLLDSVVAMGEREKIRMIEKRGTTLGDSLRGR